MPGHDDHDLERRLREQRPVARDEFVQGLAAKTRSRSHPTARPRLTLAFALSLALLVSLVAFGGVGAAKNAVSSSASSVRSAWAATGTSGTQGRQRRQRLAGASSVPRQGADLLPEGQVRRHLPLRDGHEDGLQVEVAVGQAAAPSHWVKVKVPVVITYQKKVRERVKTIVYREKTVQQSKVPFLVSRGAVYPVPAGGCSTLDHPDTTTT